MSTPFGLGPIEGPLKLVGCRDTAEHFAPLGATDHTSRCYLLMPNGRSAPPRRLPGTRGPGAAAKARAQRSAPPLRPTTVNAMRPKRKKNRVRGQPKPRGSRVSSNVFDPTKATIPPTLHGEVGVVPMNLTRRHVVTQEVGKAYMMCCSAQPGYGMCGVLVSWTPGGTSVAAFDYFNLPVVAFAPDAGGPTSSRFTKCGLRITCATAQLYRGGPVYVSHIPARLKFPAAASAMSGLQWDDVASTLLSYPEAGPTRTTIHEWSQFGSRGAMADRPIVCRVSDEAIYQRFLPHRGGITTADNFFDNIAMWGGGSLDTRAMTSRFVYWKAPAAEDRLQEIIINTDAQLLTRWPLDTAAGYLSKDISPAPPAEVGKSRKDEPKDTSGVGAW